MSKEAMKLALGKIKSARDCHPNAVNTLLFEAEEILEEALEKPDFWEGYVPEQVKPATEESLATQAQQALDKKAENARELGLDYEPVCNKDPQGCWNVRCQLGKKCKNTQAQRTWVSLTDEDYRELHLEMGPTYFYQDYGRAIEAKLKEKNT